MTEHIQSHTQQMSTAVQQAIEAFRAGNPILIHDFEDREGETDLVYPADVVNPSDVTRLRNVAGGLICVALANDVAEEFGLPYAHEVLDHPATANDDLAYDDRSSFSVTVNHRDTYTGITDKDRARTISALGEAAKNPAEFDFAGEFRIPGHVHILRAAPDLLVDRRGHTELGIALAEETNRAPAVVVTEMLDDETGEALPPARAREFADAHGYPFVEGRDLVAALGA